MRANDVIMHAEPPSSPHVRRRVVVVGGGLAGLTAARRLLQSGCAVELLEARSILGGKVSSWRDADGDWIESGLHVFFGAYDEIFTLMRELGIYDNILWKPHMLRYTLAGGDHFDFETWPLPSPLHLFPTVLRNTYFTWPEKLTLVRALPRMVLGSDDYYEAQDAITYEEWHLTNGISRRMLRRMFLPMALALKFVPPDAISARVVLDVSGLFLRQRDASRMGFLSGSPQDKLIGPLENDIRRRGGTIRVGAKATALLPDPDGTLGGVRLANGEIVRGDAFVLALPIHQLNRIIPQAWRHEPYFERLGHFEGVPVMTAQLWLDQQVTGIDNILFSPDGLIPVYADLGNTTPDYRCGGRSRIEVVVAPARQIFDWDDRAIVAKVWQDIQSVFPRRTAGVSVVKATVVRIPQSVYWPKPGLNALRPTQRTPIANLYLAGGYTRQRFYDSMEGAVASGNRAAQALIDDATRWD
jgi:15-cis-phytoene desaturase